MMIEIPGDLFTTLAAIFAYVKKNIFLTFFFKTTNLPKVSISKFSENYS